MVLQQPPSPRGPQTLSLPPSLKHKARQENQQCIKTGKALQDQGWEMLLSRLVRLFLPLLIVSMSAAVTKCHHFHNSHHQFLSFVLGKIPPVAGPTQPDVNISVVNVLVPGKPVACVPLSCSASAFVLVGYSKGNVADQLLQLKVFLKARLRVLFFVLGALYPWMSRRTTPCIEKQIVEDFACLPE